MTFARKFLTQGSLAVALAVAAPITMTAEDHSKKEMSSVDKTVKQAQKKLKKAGLYDGKADGVPGPETAAAVQAFQKGKGLPETGRLDAATLAALDVKRKDKDADGPLADAAHATEKGVKKAASATEKGVRAGGEATGEGLQKAGEAVEDAFDKDDKASKRADEIALTADETRAAQKKLADKGHYQGKVDGVAGPDTEAAIRHFQKQQNLPETGRLDGKTRAALGIR